MSAFGRELRGPSRAVPTAAMRARKAPTPDASLLLGGRRRIPLDDFVLRVDGRAYGRPADAAPLAAFVVLPPGGAAPAWGVAVVTLAVLFREALRVARCLTKRKRS